MNSVSICLIVKNEEKVLARCLNSLGDLADELVVVDTGSSDSTVEIAKLYTDKVYNFEWQDDFAKARNFAFDKATKNYIMWLDADDVIADDDRKKLNNLKKELNQDIDMVVCRYNLLFDEKKNVTFYSTRERIFRRNYGYKWCGVVHEVIPIEGKVLYRDDIAINHMTEHKDYKQSNQRNIAIYEKTIKQQKELDSRTIFYYARELHDGGRYIESVHYLNMFLDRDDGWVEDKINACMLLAKIYRDKFCDNSNAIRYALKTMSYSVLRVETCCFLGYLYKNNKDFLQAVDWFDLALHLPKKNEKGFVNMDYYEYIPNIELSVCFDKLGNRDLAKFYNEKAGVIKPYSTAYLHNKKYFDSI